MRKLSALQEKYFGKGRKAKPKRRAHKPTRTLGGHAGIKAKKGAIAVDVAALKNGKEVQA